LTRGGSSSGIAFVPLPLGCFGEAIAFYAERERENGRGKGERRESEKREWGNE
jgi:hypothetical protein